ncbi:bifunctional DNA primase/polymerase [Gordonia sp. 852002-50395_SCH5434458]|uniref:bifunctional DNA primase/polymerase n=1 Tax=Gordonia sp. 852002-50395_SCH5434458 TaxID=1834090 RepID=UPI0007EA4CD5|nr:bifunctional DNA primase/polymerase [Gordonia sp. 852002-50395_SCH5434458]OBC01723.1 hypothetical protein A5785_17140 [Gordonia sp. 852002-50395_SCH5434458]
MTLLGDLDLDAAFDDDEHAVNDDDNTVDDSFDSDGDDDGGVDTSTGYGAAALQYRDAGWDSVLPLPRGCKYPPPRGYTGDGATVPSHADVYAWTEDYADANLALRMPDGVIGIDVDAYGTKRGGDTLAAAESAWGPLPPTVRSTSRPDDASGIQLFVVPLCKRLVGQLTIDGKSDVEIVQAHHRYCVAYPSIHPSGARYRWFDADSAEVDIPCVGDLPMLPDRWIAELTAAPVASVAGVEVDVAAVLHALPDGEPDHVVAKRLNEALADLRSRSGSRHDATLRHVLALMRFGVDGHSGVRSALLALHEAFVAAVVGDGRSESSASGEFRRMVTNERGHQLLAATPTVDFDELVDLVDAEVPVPAVAAPASPPPPPPSSPTAMAAMPDDDDFWGSRASLRHIRDAALGRMAAPWGVLGSVTTRAACTIPWTVTLPPLIGGPGSLNSFTAMVGASGGGKGACEAVARELVPHNSTVGAVEVGSGEGLAHQYVRRATPGDREDGVADANDMVWVRRSVLFSVAEVDTLAALGTRNGATLMGKLRNGWSGEELGFGYATKEKALLVGSHGYRMGLTVGVQPQRAEALLGDAAGGTPQRFVWVRVTDPRIRRDRASDAPIWPLALPDAWPLDPWTMPVPAVARDTVLDAHVARQRGEGDALDGHALFARLKVMAALAVIDGRIEPNEEDWELAGIVMAHSDRVRQEVADELAAASRTEAIERGQLVGIERDAAQGSAYAEKLDRVCGVILRGVKRLSDKGRPATEGNIGRLIAGRDRDIKSDALEALVLRRALIHDGRSGVFSLPDA